jgi:hypothetical protein
MIATAKVFDQSRNAFDFTMPMATIMAIHSCVAEGAAASAVEGMAAALASGNSTHDLSSHVEQLEQVCMSSSCKSCVCLAAAVESAMFIVHASMHQHTYAAEKCCSKCDLGLAYFDHWM